MDLYFDAPYYSGYVNDQGNDRTSNSYPYKFSKNYQIALQLISEALSGETADRLFYTYLISEAPSQEDKEIIAGIRDDEMKHFELFTQIYFELVGQIPPSVKEDEFIKPMSYCQGIKKALLGEMAAVEKYRKILFGMEQRSHINMLVEIITDELRHGNLYNLLYSKNECYTEEVEKENIEK